MKFCRFVVHFRLQVEFFTISYLEPPQSSSCTHASIILKIYIMLQEFFLLQRINFNTVLCQKHLHALTRPVSFMLCFNVNQLLLFGADENSGVQEVYLALSDMVIFSICISRMTVIFISLNAVGAEKLNAKVKSLTKDPVLSIGNTGNYRLFIVLELAHLFTKYKHVQVIPKE